MPASTAAEAEHAILLVPAAGAGTRLGSALPKVLTPVAGRPMLDYLLDLYAPVVGRFLLVVRPGAEPAVIERGRARGLEVECGVQPAPTGMLDAILVPLERVRRLAPRWVWITWCDQVAVLPATVAALQAATRVAPAPHLTFPTCRQEAPYIHFDRDEAGRIVGLRQRREGDAMPGEGESDSGLFVLSFEAYTEMLPRFARTVTPGRQTGERNFLPFIAWLSARHPEAVRTVACLEVIESIGINTPDELRRVAEHLARRAGVAQPRNS